MKKPKSKIQFLELTLVFMLVLFVLLLYAEVLLSGKCLYGSDFVAQFYPWKRLLYDSLQNSGSLPFWNPYLFSGSPFVTNIQASMFYPLGFLYYIAPPETAYVYSTLLHFVLGSIFMYLFMRSLHVHPVSGFFGSVVFTFNGYFMGHLYAGHLSFVQNYIWIPLIFLFLNRLIVKASFPNALAAGLLLGIQILGGFPQLAFYTILASSLFVLFGVVYHLRGVQNISPIKLGGGWLLFVLAGFSLSAVQVLPTFEFTTLSTRGGGIGYAMATYESLHPKELLAFLIPEIFGNPVDGTYWPSQESWHFWESCGYVGILPLLLLFVKAKNEGGKRVEVFFFFLAALSLFLALGKYNPIYPLIYRLPGFNSFRIPAQIIFLYSFSLAVLSGIGLDRISAGQWSFRRGFVPFALFVGGILAVAAVGVHFFPYRFFFLLFQHLSEGPVTHADLSLLYCRVSVSVNRAALFFFLPLFLLWAVKARRLRTGFFGVIACAMLFFDLYLFGAQFVRSYEFVTPVEKKQLLDRLPKTPVDGRVVTMDAEFGTNDGLMYRFPSIQGYDPLILKTYADFVLSSQGFPPDDHVVNMGWIANPKAKLIELLHVKHIVFSGQVRTVEEGMPYAYFVEQAIFNDRHDILSYMKSDAFIPEKAVMLEGEPRPGKIQGVQTYEPLTASYRLLSYGHEEIRLEASLNRPAYLVLSEIFYPGWYASVNGRKAEILRGNYTFRVIPLEAGEHEVRLYFVSWPFRIGAVVSLLALGLSFCFLIFRQEVYRDCR